MAEVNSKNYVNLSMRTADVPPEFSARRRLAALQNLDMLHAAMGAATEAGELVDEMKRVIFYGKQLDYSNIREELGDVLWYIALACDTLGFTLEEVMETNVKKLAVRYPEKFSGEAALNRDLAAEKAVL